MSRQIYVQAQADHIASLAKATPLAAIEELVWNALDADAHEVRIEVLTNPIQGIQGIRISDDGAGIDVLRADDTFGSLGGSWKRTHDQTLGTHRRLHGRHGRGRFKAFALGAHVEWRTTVRTGGELLSYRITGELENPGAFTLDAVGDTGPATGTEVWVDAISAVCVSLLDVAEAVQALASKFALYLRSYPDVRIFFNGLPVTPVVVQRNTIDYRISVGDGGAEARLQIIEWKRRFAGSGRLVFAGPDGFELYERPAAVRSGGASFTAYLVSPRFPVLAAENALVMEELHPEVRGYIDAARKAIKRHFAAASAESVADLIAQWQEEGSYPFGRDDATPQRTRFDGLATELSHRMDGFVKLRPSARGIVLRLLRRAAEAVPTGTLKEIVKQENQ